MARLIELDTEKLIKGIIWLPEKWIKIFDKTPTYNEGWNQCNRDWLKRLDEFPTVDAVEVVRCKDCKYYTSKYSDCVWWSNLEDVVTEPDCFCSYGVRMDGDKE